MVRLLLLLLGSLTAGRSLPGQAADWPRAENPGDPPEPGTVRTAPLPARPARKTGGRRPHRRRVPRWAVWGGLALLTGLVFRRIIAWLVLTALSAAFHLAGIHVHLPSVRFGWPWQTLSAGTSTTADLGPWVLQKIEGISRPALGQANFSFYFTHKVSKNIGPWPCWYAATFYAVGHASATVDLNPGRAWWRPSTGHYRLQVVSRPWHAKPGHVTVTMTLPPPRLPGSASDVTIDNIPSKPIDTQHSWTYPGLGCGMVIRPQFPDSVLYAEAQHIAFYKARNAPQVTGPMIRAAENEAGQMIRDNFVQPTVNAFGYDLDSFTLRWAAAAGAS